MSYHVPPEDDRRRLFAAPAHQIGCPTCPALGPPAGSLKGAIDKAKADGWEFRDGRPVGCPECRRVLATGKGRPGMPGR